MAPHSFLSGLKSRPATGDWPSNLARPHLFLGRGSPSLEVVVAEASALPSDSAIRSAWKKRVDGRASPVLLAVVTVGDVRLCGPLGDRPRVIALDHSTADRLCREALSAPDRHASVEVLRGAFDAEDDELIGLRNEGFLASHVLKQDAPSLAGWVESCEHSRRLRDVGGAELIRGLGYAAERHDNHLDVLRVRSGRKVAVAIHLREGEQPELPNSRFGSTSPVSYALAVADRENIPYVLVTRGTRLRLYPARPDTSVARRPPHETFVQADPPLLPEARVGYLWTLFSAEALAEDGPLAELLRRSQDFAGDLAKRLRERIYERVVPHLAQSLARARRITSPTAEQLAETFEMTLLVLFRLLFIAYAEDRELLPYRHNEGYRRRSLKSMAKELAALAAGGEPAGPGERRWGEIRRLFKAVADGDPELGVPAYDGGLFSSDSEVSPVGAALETVSLPDDVLRPILTDLLCIEVAPGGPLGPVDFRSLGVRDFGTIYEGLLESELALAEHDLTTDSKGVFRPAKPKETPAVQAGEVYLHNRSGARKATGSYFTKSFVVDHLLEKALVPALAGHCARLDRLDDDAAADRLFDFRVADIAMGSGHFLVAAIDVIERAFREYLLRRPLPGVTDELERLRDTAQTALRRGEVNAEPAIEATQLLRRQIARRCVYGVDINPMAVDLARLSVWIHTFVPGLPLSLLDHSLVVGNSLVGIGQISEMESVAPPALASLYLPSPQELVGEALAPLTDLARLADASAAEIKVGRDALRRAKMAAAPASALCDIATACRQENRHLPDEIHPWRTAKPTIVGSQLHRDALKVLGAIRPFHFPVAFPEVFQRERPGFDVLLGNPPWQEATIEEHAFWARHAPGLRGLTQREQETEKSRLRRARPDLARALERELSEMEAMRRALVTGPYPGMGTGDPDLYKAFAWRFWQLACPEGGRVGVVLPRSALSAKGSERFRRDLLAGSGAVDITVLVNNRLWVFPEVHPQYSIGLIEVVRGQGDQVLLLGGPFRSEATFRRATSHTPARFPIGDVLSWSDTASLPLLPTEDSAAVFAKLRASPRLDLAVQGQWRARPHTDLHATNDKHLMDLKSATCPAGFWPVFKGESFDLWTPDTGRYYGWADAGSVVNHLLEKRRNGRDKANSVWAEFADRKRSWFDDPATLPCQAARIAFRDVTRATDTRTFRCALVPPHVFLTNQAPFLLWPRGEHTDAAFLLGVLSSRTLDWYARRFVETHVSFFLFNPLPVPRPPASSRLRARTVELAGRLASPDDRFAEWAEAVRVACGPLAGDEKADMVHELDAVVTHLYGLDEKDLVHIFETFHEGWEHGPDLAATLRHFRSWAERI